MSRGIKSVLIFVAFAALVVLSRHTISHSATTTQPSTATTVTSTTAPSGSTTTIAQVSSTCVGSDFTGTWQNLYGAAGTGYSQISLMKKSGSTCVVDGHAIITLQDKYGAVLHSVIVNLPRGAASYINFPDTAANATAVPVTVSIGQKIGIDVATSDVQIANTACESIASLSVQFATGGVTIPITPPYPVSACGGGKLWLSPFFTLK